MNINKIMEDRKAEARKRIIEKIGDGDYTAAALIADYYMLEFEDLAEIVNAGLVTLNDCLIMWQLTKKLR